MFSGIIEEIGVIRKIDKIEGGIRLSISANDVIGDLKAGDSISVDGVCLTVTSFDTKLFMADAVGETLSKTTLSLVKPDYLVNLERAIMYNQRIGGHLVQGHINSTAKIILIKKRGKNFLITIKIPSDIMKYIIKEGSIAVNGISLTVAEILNDQISISIIPHTWENTTLKYKKKNDQVNIEVDLIAKYVENFIGINAFDKKNISENMLKNLGY